MALKTRLLDIIDPDTDSLRFYNLGAEWDRRVDYLGTTWFEEKARYQTQGLTEEQVIQIVREEIRDYLIRNPRS